MLGSADLVEEISVGSDKIIKITGVGHIVSTLLRGSNKLVLEEVRSIHDALCVIRCLVKERALIAGGVVREIELSVRLAEYAQSLSAVDQYCISTFAEAL